MTPPELIAWLYSNLELFIIKLFKFKEYITPPSNAIFSLKVLSFISIENEFYIFKIDPNILKFYYC